MSRLGELARWLYRYPGPTLNTASGRNLRTFSQSLLAGAHDGDLRILNIGGGGRALPSRHVHPRVRAGTLYLDIRRTPLVSVVGDALHLPFADGSFDAALSLALLEHVPDAQHAVAEMGRVLKLGGLLYCEVPFLQVYHAAPADYVRFTESGVRRLFKGFRETDFGVCAGPSSALSWVLRKYIAGVLSGFSEHRRARQAAEFLAAWLTFPIKYLDLLMADRPAAREMASAFFYTGVKK